MQDISGFGLVATLRASNTFPAGIQITQFADDSDPADMASVQIADKAMGLNGDLVVWAKAVPLPVILNVIPGGEDDINLEILANNNRVGRGKTGTRDVLTLTLAYPDGRIVTYVNGKLTDAMFGNSVSSAGRQKTKAYGMAFENIAG